MKDQNKEPAIYRDQLRDLKSFIQFCADRDFKHESGKAFFDAALKEGILRPILTDGEVELFSPHQLVSLVLLKENEPNEEGLLEYPKPIYWDVAGPTQKVVRALRWGPWEGVSEKEIQDIISWNEMLNDFLRIVHSLPILKQQGQLGYDDEPYWASSPNLSFNFSEVTDPKKKTYIRFKELSEDSLRFIRLRIAQWGFIYDPMQKWFYFVRRLPRRYREQLRYDARLAQEFYDLDNLICEFLEQITGKIQPGIYELADQDKLTASYLNLNTDLVKGYDIRSLKEASSTLAALEGLDTYLTSQDRNVLKQVHENLENFSKHFGEDWSIPNGKKHKTPPTDKLAAENLPEKYRKAFKPGGKTKLATLIIIYLRDIWSDLINLIADLQKRLRALTQKELPEFYRPQDEVNLTPELERLGRLQKKLKEIFTEASHIKCMDCRAGLVNEAPRPIDGGDLLCKTCIEKKSEMVLSGEESKFMSAHEGEWRCPFCEHSRLLYKFANRNVLVSQSRNDAFSSIKLEYGKMRVKIRCPKCSHVDEKIFAYGWEE